MDGCQILESQATASTKRIHSFKSGALGIMSEDLTATAVVIGLTEPMFPLTLMVARSRHAVCCESRPLPRQIETDGQR